MRFAGTWKQYSKNAIPQLTKITAHSADDLNFKCPYHAKVMKILEISNKNIGAIALTMINSPADVSFFTIINQTGLLDIEYF